MLLKSCKKWFTTSHSREKTCCNFGHFLSFFGRCGCFLSPRGGVQRSVSLSKQKHGLTLVGNRERQRERESGGAEEFPSPRGGACAHPVKLDLCPATAATQSVSRSFAGQEICQVDLGRLRSPDLWMGAAPAEEEEEDMSTSGFFAWPDGGGSCDSL